MWLMEGRAARYTFSCTICTLSQSLAYQQRNCKANTKCCQTHLILLNFLGFPWPVERLIVKAQGSSFAVSPQTPHRLPARYAVFCTFVFFCITVVVLTLCSVLILHISPLLCFIQVLLIFKYFLCPIKGLTFHASTFFNMSLSQKTLLNPLANVTVLKLAVCCYSLIPLLSLPCAQSCSVWSQQQPLCLQPTHKVV